LSERSFSSRCQISCADLSASSRARTWAIGPVTEAELFSRRTSEAVPAGGARRDRTDDLLLAKQALSQLSYGPGEPARLRPNTGFGGQPSPCWRLAGRSCVAAKAGGPGKT